MTQETLEPPRIPPSVACGHEDDYIRELGDAIAALSAEQVSELHAYLTTQGTLGLPEMRR